MHIGTYLPTGISPEKRRSFATDAEQRGFDSLWTGELWGDDSVVTMTDVARSTDEIELGTGIVNTYSRTPAVLTMASSALDKVSDGRFTLGIGPSTPVAIERLHGLEFVQPVRRGYETMELIGAFTGDDEYVSYEGGSAFRGLVPAARRRFPGVQRCTGRREPPRDWPRRRRLAPEYGTSICAGGDVRGRHDSRTRPGPRPE